MKVPDIIKQVFADHPAADFKLDLTGTYKKWTYCVQYRETDFNFVSRLMEQEGIGYYFRHTDGHDTMVLTDSTSKHTPAAGYEKLPFIAPMQQVKPDTEHVRTWDFGQQVQPGMFVHDDYDLERPSVELKTAKKLPRGYTPSDYEVYDYPGAYVQASDGEHYASVRIDEMGTQFESAQAATNARGIAVGSTLKLEHHPREDQNKEYLIVGANYDLTFENYESLPEGVGTSYTCTFQAMPTSQQFRPKRLTPKPFVQGPQTAVVVGPGGEEIYTDKYGRVKVQFHWDRRGKKDENSSCWIRVSHPWAGKGWGAISNPRIGQEVIVDFLEGDPDQPIITGRVYNAEQMPPYDLPANQTQSGMKSRSSKGGSGSNFNEIRMEDKMGAEQLFIHAEKNQDIEVEKDETHWVGQDRKKTVDRDETTHVKHDRTETVGNDETITIEANRTESVTKNEKIGIGGSRSITVNRSETASVLLQRTHSVGINETITVGGAQEITVGGVQTITAGASQTITAGAGQNISAGITQGINAGSNQSINAGGNQTINVGKNGTMTIAGDETRTVSGKRESSVSNDDTLHVGKHLSFTAGESVTITTGDASIQMRKNGSITIKGKNITIEDGGKLNAKASGDIIMKGSKIVHN
jgi:type VI secretion system secreted protein VgrG